MRARVAGALYVLCIVCGFYAEMVVRAKLIVYSDAAATAQNILAAQSLYRLGFFADVSAMALGLLAGVILYTLFRPVSRGVALTVLVLDVVSNTISICGAVLLYAPLVVLQSADLLAPFTDAQRQSFALLSIHLYELSYALNLAFFSGSCVLTGYLIFRSTFLPRALGILLVIAGACYLTNSLVDFMPKGFADWLFPWILLPCALSEAALALWLLVMGVNATKWGQVDAADRRAAA
jgi:hypothetical protein